MWRFHHRRYLIVVAFGATLLTFLSIYHDLTSELVVGLQHIAADSVSAILGSESQGKVGTIDTTSLRGHGTDHLLLQSKSTAGQKSTEVKKVMHPDTFYFTILRHPVEQAVSAFSYFKSSASAFRNVDSLDSFMQNPLRFFRPGAKGNYLAHNLMWFDLGLDPEKNHTQTQLQKIFSSLDDTFSIVLLADYFDESMVLLRHALCWSLDDVVTFKINSRSNASIKAISQETAVRLRQWNSLDWALYSHFNTSFWDRAVHFGLERLDAEVQELRARRNVLATLCLQGSALEAKIINDTRFKPYQQGTVEILGYKLKPGLSNEEFSRCSRLIVPGLQYEARLFARQFPKKIRTPMN
uniref:galactose-3-O-sulfotransferase 2-like isoform X2 n=1 Tax=Myxine glutinosa TaxID=7769 RepID=UPI00358DFC7D